MSKHRSLVSSRHRSRGFTLVELMVTVTLLAILLAIAVPSFRNFIAAQRVKTAAFELGSALMMSRSEAIKRNASITLAPNSGGWAAGWTVKSGTTTLFQQEALPGITIDEASSSSSLVFNNTGRITGSLPSFEISTGTSYVYYRCIRVDVSGMFNTKSTQC